MAMTPLAAARMRIGGTPPRNARGGPPGGGSFWAPNCTRPTLLASGARARKRPSPLPPRPAAGALDSGRPLEIGPPRMDERTKQPLVLGREHYSKREFDRAEPLLREVLEREDRFADVHDMLGVIAHSRGNFIAAEKHFE